MNVNEDEKNLKDKETELSDIAILSAHDVDINLLVDFYNIVYPWRANPRIWKWLNRSPFYDNKIPLVILYNDRVIAHAGIIPFKVSLNGKYYTSSWFIDLAVLPEFQRQGLGKLLTKRWMEFSDFYVTFCNEKSIGVFKKYGWVESFDTHLHYYPLMPFNHHKFDGLIPAFLRKILNSASRTFFNIIYHKYASSGDNLCLDDLSSDSLRNFTTSLDVPDNTVTPIRDYDYISWRLLDSPDRDKYRIFSIRDVSIIIKMYDKYHPRYPKHIDLLWVSNPSNYSVIRHMISTLAIWGMANDYSYIRHYTSDRELSDYLRKSLKSMVRHRRFAFYSKDIALLDKLKYAKWHWELMDSDFEEF